MITRHGVGRFVAGKVLALLAIVSMLVGGRWLAFSVQDLGKPSATARSSGNDALWLGHAWVYGRKSSADVEHLADMLRGTGIRDLFVHTGPLADNGTLDPAKAPRAKWFADKAHALMPGVRVQAWLGDEVKPKGAMDLEAAPTRQAIVASVRQVLALGFDGVHLDLEPVGDADPGYLDLLGALHPFVHASGAILSVSAEQVEPLPGTRWAMESVEGHSSWWSAAYLRQVAARVDQVALMTYDTALWTSSAYTGFVRDETAVALRAVPSGVAVLIGLPAFHDAHDLGHSSSAETVAAAVRGVRLGLGAHPATGRAFGVALYVDFTATPSDWAAYRAEWMGQPAT